MSAASSVSRDTLWQVDSAHTISGVKDCAGMGVQMGPGATAGINPCEIVMT